MTSHDSDVVAPDAADADTVKLAASLWGELVTDTHGLVPAIVQSAIDARVLMLGYMNEAALAATLARRRVTFFSRSRNTLWEKGEQSGHVLELVALRSDCDRDTLLVTAIPKGPTCHTGTTSCFFRHVDPITRERKEDDGPPPPPSAMFDRVYQVILERKAGQGATNAEGKSYVRSLLERGAPKIREKILEEAGELGEALVAETDERVLSETADLLFHAFVGLAQRNLDLDDVAEVLRKRFGTSGIDEKASRVP